MFYFNNVAFYKESQHSKNPSCLDQRVRNKKQEIKLIYEEKNPSNPLMHILLKHNLRCALREEPEIIWSTWMSNHSRHGLSDWVERVNFVQLLLWTLCPYSGVVATKLSYESQQRTFGFVANLPRQFSFIFWWLWANKWNIFKSKAVFLQMIMHYYYINMQTTIIILKIQLNITTSKM